MEPFPEAVTERNTKNKSNNAINLFWLGFIVYALSYTISTSGSVNFIVCQLLQIFGLFLIVPSTITLVSWKFDNGFLQIIFITYICWLFSVIVRGFIFDYQFFKFLFFDATFGIFLYFAPLILLFPRNLFYYKKAFDVIFILSIAWVLFDMAFLKELLFHGRNLKGQAILEYFSQQLSLPAGFLLLTYMYHSGKRNLLALFVIMFTFFLAAIRARRGLMFISVSILISSYFMFYYAKKVKLIIFLISIVLISAIYLMGTKFYNENRKGLFGYITDRIDANTRSGVEIAFYKDMNTTDWIVGKGIQGEYYCPGVDFGTYTTHRGVVETGFLQIILKGGIISLLLLLLILIPAIIKGIFNSQNLLSKAAGIWILLFLIDLYPAVPTNFSMNYLLVWISVGICYSDEIRNMPESDIKEVFLKTTT